LGIEVAKILKRVDSDVLLDLSLSVLGGGFQPWMLQSSFGRWSLILIKSKKLSNEIFALIGD